MRKGQSKRISSETQIELTINLDGSGKRETDIPCGFISHMMELFAGHGRFDLKIDAAGDTYVDDHHLVEDLGISLGTAVKEALGDKVSITRYGSFIMPMDEALILVALDISGRAYLGFDATFTSEKIGNFDSELVEEFFLAFSRSLGCTLHIKMLEGKNSHHIAEGIFKAFARALSQAVSIDKRFEGEIPSTKGLI